MKSVVKNPPVVSSCLEAPDVMQKKDFNVGQCVLWDTLEGSAYVKVLRLEDSQFFGTVLKGTGFHEGYKDWRGRYSSGYRLVSPDLAASLEKGVGKNPAPTANVKTSQPSTTAAPKKEYCWCCSKFAGDVEILHEDPCQYTYLERYMLPGARALYRRDRFKKDMEENERKSNIQEAAALAEQEKHMADAGFKMYNGRIYKALTGR